MANELERFVGYLLELTPEEFLGVAKLLKVDIVVENEEKVSPRDAEDIMLDVVNTFQEMNRVKRRRMMKMMNAVHKDHVKDKRGKEVEDGSPTED